MIPSIELIHADARGEIYSISLPDNRELMLLHSKPGSFRGGHSHDCGEVVMVLSGTLVYQKRHLSGIEYTEICRQGQLSYNPPGEIHMGEFSVDTWLIEYKFAEKGQWTQLDYQPYRERVRESIGQVLH